MHVQDVLLGRVVVDDLGPLDDAVRAQVAGARARQQRADVRPLHQVRRRVAVDVLEGRPVRLVLADQVVRRPDLDGARPVRLHVLACVRLFSY